MFATNSLPFTQLVRPAARAGLAWFADEPRDLRMEAMIAERLALVQRQANVGDGILFQMRTKQGAISRQPCRSRGLLSQVDRVRREQGIVLAERVGAIAGLAAMSRVLDHRGAHRVQLDVAHARQQIGLGLDQRRLVAAVPQRPGTPVSLCT